MSKTTLAIVGLCAFAAGLLCGLVTASLASGSLREIRAERDELAKELVEVRADADELRRRSLKAAKVMDDTAKLIDDHEDARQAAETALMEGTGHDWINLTDQEKMLLCIEVAERMGKVKKLAWAYREFLDGVYGGNDPGPRSQRIAEMIAVCQLFIEKGKITLE